MMNTVPPPTDNGNTKIEGTKAFLSNVNVCSHEGSVNVGLDEPKNSQDGPKKAWVSLVTNEAYLRGALTLSFSLLKSGTKYPFYVIYTDVYADSLIF